MYVREEQQEANEAGEKQGPAEIRINGNAFGQEASAVQKQLVKECIAAVRGGEKRHRGRASEGSYRSVQQTVRKEA